MLGKLNRLGTSVWVAWRTEGLSAVITVFCGYCGHIPFVWSRFWMQRAGLDRTGRLATRLATWGAPPYWGRRYLADLSPHGYVSPSAEIVHQHFLPGRHIFIGDRVIVFQDRDGGPVELHDRVRLYNEVSIHTGDGGALTIGPDTHVHLRTILSAYKGSIHIGSGVQIAPQCAFYSYDHGMDPDLPVMRQPFETKGDIVIGDEAWLGFGVTVLSGVRIGKGAVIGARSVVTHDVPDGAIAVGTPARTVTTRAGRRRSMNVLLG